MTDQADHRADSGRNESDKQRAEVLTTSGPDDDPDVFLVEYPDGEVAYEPGTPRNQALFGHGLYDEIDGDHAFDSVGTPVELRANVQNDEYAISVDGHEVPVPSDRIDDVIEAWQSTFVGDRLKELYNDITEGQVRRNVIERFRDRFPEDRVEVTADGWEIDDTFVVTYEAENFLLNQDPVSPSGNEYDDSKQAVYLDLNAYGEREVVDPHGDSVVLDETEQLFLAQVEGLLYPGEYFDVELVDEIQQHKAVSVMDDIESITEQAEVTGFTDSKTNIHHGSTNHGFQKHRLSDLGVTDEVSDLLWAHDYDHAGVVELNMRKDELVSRPDVNIFVDAPDDDADKWEKIERTKENAPIPSGVRKTLEDMYA